MLNILKSFNNSDDSQAGFTIVELMIATAVLSTILLLATVLMTNIGNLYQKGVNQANTQDEARSIIDQASQDLKYNPSFTSGSAQTSLPGGTAVTIYAYCIGSVRYSFITGYKIGSSGTDTTPQGGSYPWPVSPHVLWRDNGSSTYTTGLHNITGCTPVNVTDPDGALVTSDPSGTELIAPNSRLSAFSISDSSPYNIVVGVAYGDVDLLSNAGSMLSNLTTYSAGTPVGNPTTVSVTCAGNEGDQFCTTASLSTAVVPRIAGGS